jgi:BirA family transcriptional regulator, biotin operon repressor / biotin---[acetyl-CoA-carboxylase] ligase
VKWSLLEALRKRAGEWTAPAELAAETLDAPAEVERAVSELRADGYVISRRRGGKIRFTGCGDRLITHEIKRDLKTKIIGRQVTVLERVASTNDAAWQAALSGAPEGTVIFAEEQTAGRGRMGRQWISPPRSGLLFSVVLRPELEVQQSNLLTVVSAVAVAEALQERLGLHARIRWPNDITVRDRKVAGILVEGRSLATGSAFVLGIGVNVRARPKDFPAELRETATSLAAEAKTPPDRNDLGRGLLASLDRWYGDLRQGEYGHIARRWRRLSSTLGERVILLENGREFRGRVLDLSLEDGLIVRLDEGVTRIFHPSTVTLRQMPERRRGLNPRRESVE